MFNCQFESNLLNLESPTANCAATFLHRTDLYEMQKDGVSKLFCYGCAAQLVFEGWLFSEGERDSLEARYGKILPIISPELPRGVSSIMDAIDDFKKASDELVVPDKLMPSPQQLDIPDALDALDAIEALADLATLDGIIYNNISVPTQLSTQDTDLGVLDTIYSIDQMSHSTFNEQSLKRARLANLYPHRKQH